MEFSGLKESLYTLKVLATNRKPDKELIRRKFEVTADPNRCTLHLINNGVTVTADTATVEFAGRGPVEEYWCRVNQKSTLCVRVALTYFFVYCIIINPRAHMRSEGLL